MFSIWSVSLLALLYLALLFIIAWWADKYKPKRFRALFYSLTLGVYCTSWAFFGTTAQAANHGWWLAPTYAGTLILFLFGWRLYCRVAQICRDEKLTSLADFIASRYGQSSSLSGLVSFISVIAIVPYISLQLSATSESIAMLTGEEVSSGGFWQDSTFYIMLLLALFAVLFGARRPRPSEHNPGLVASMAFESLVKLAAFISVGLFVCFGLFDSPLALWQQAQSTKAEGRLSFEVDSGYIYATHTLLGVLAMFCLPRQFHMQFIEPGGEGHLSTARWLFPLYLILINLFILPIAVAGLLWFGKEQVAPDSFVLALPMAVENHAVSLMVFLGGFSAATSMVIVSAIVLSIMITNDFINQFILRRSSLASGSRGLSQNALLQARRAVIFALLLLSYFTHRILADTNSLAMVGLMSFSLVAQFAPALIIGLWWRQASCLGAQLGIASGSLVWFYTLLLPNLVIGAVGYQPWLDNGPFGVQALAPRDLLGLGLDDITQSMLLSLGLNLMVYILLPVLRPAGLAERLQSSKFVISRDDRREGVPKASLSFHDLAALLKRFGEADSASQLVASEFPLDPNHWKADAPVRTEQLVERELAAMVGGASARLIIDAAKDEKHQGLEQVAEFVDEAREVLRFNRDLLQSTIENIQQGISVVDSQLRLVAWNQGYKDMFLYPDEALYIGRPVEEIIRLNAHRGMFRGEDPEQEIAKRLDYLRQGSAYKYQRTHSNGRVYEMQGNPLPGGGFVTTYTDVTDFVSQQRQLEHVNASLEEKVNQRTRALTQANRELSNAKRVAEQATESKTRFFAAASHDLLQPFNAASLFCSLMSDKARGSELETLADNIRSSLGSAEELLSSILELTKLNAGAFKVNVSEFPLRQIIDPLRHEYQALAAQKGIGFHLESQEVLLNTDKALLKRVLRNLLSNAIRYTEQGEVRLKTYLENGLLSLIVEDTGIGIAKEDQLTIFEEFKQLGSRGNAEGLGLGLAITKRICDLLDIPLLLGSQVGTGTQFTLLLQCKSLPGAVAAVKPKTLESESDFAGLRVWLVDNDQTVLEALGQVMGSWGCEIEKATGAEQLAELQARLPLPQLLIVDYQLDAGLTGVELLASQGLSGLPVIINTANQAESIREQVSDAGFPLLYKPLKLPALRRSIKRLLN